MARKPLDPPSHFGRRVSSAIRRELGDRRMSGRTLALLLGRSEAYVRQRLNDTFEFTLTDVEAFAISVLKVLPEAFIGSIDWRAKPTDLDGRDVGGRPEDYDLIANESINENPGDEPDYNA